MSSKYITGAAFIAVLLILIWLGTTDEKDTMTNEDRTVHLLERIEQILTNIEITLNNVERGQNRPEYPYIPTNRFSAKGPEHFTVYAGNE